MVVGFAFVSFVHLHLVENVVFWQIVIVLISYLFLSILIKI